MEDIYAYIDAHLAEALADLERLCRQPSVSAQNLGLEETAELTATLLREAGLTPLILPVPGGPPAVYGQAPGESAYTLLFYNHYDVQPPEPLELWASPPFEPAIREGAFFARGAADNKGNIIARLAAIKAWRVVRGTLPVGVKFFIEGEEETGSPHLGPVVETHRSLLQADSCLWEGGGLNFQGQPTLLLGVKGIMYVELEARGASRDVHSSWATVVPNPAWRLVWALASLKDSEERSLIPGHYERMRRPTEAELAAARAMPSEEEGLGKSLEVKRWVKGMTGQAFKERHLFEPTCTICGLESGYTGEGSKTVLPSRARAKVDFRLVPDQTPEDILAKLRRHLDRLGFSDIAITPLTGEKPARTPLDHPFVRKVAEAAREVYSVAPVVVPTAAGSGPMSYFSEVLGLPTVAAGVEHPESREHAPNENIRLEDFQKGTKHVAALLGRLAGPQARTRD